MWNSRLRFGLSSPDLGEDCLEECYGQFREHCIERHRLVEDDTESYMFFNFEEGTLTLCKHDD
jgi:hypothetical protein